jgi:hypothetical protein
MNSSKNQSSQTLAAPNRERRLLTELANLRDDHRSIERFQKRWRYLLEPELPMAAVRQWAIRGEEEDVVYLTEDEILWKYWLLPLRAFVRHLWGSDARTKQAGFSKILEKFFGISFQDPEVGPWTSDRYWRQGGSLPPESKCERIFKHLAELTSVCLNAECPAPYFFPSRRGQKYCSEVCAGPAQRLFKKTWWRKHGKDWRAKRRASLRRMRPE